MATVNVVLKKNKKYTDGKQPLYIRITKGNNSKYISLGFRVNQNDWLKDKQKVRKGVENSILIECIQNPLIEVKTLTLSLTLPYYSLYLC